MLKYHSYSISSIRRISTGVLYYLARLNYEWSPKKTISNTYKATLLSFDKMVLANGFFLRKSFVTLQSYAQSDSKAQTKFKEEVLYKLLLTYHAIFISLQCVSVLRVHASSNVRLVR
jgi:hypothetical protein